MEELFGKEMMSIDADIMDLGNFGDTSASNIFSESDALLFPDMNISSFKPATPPETAPTLSTFPDPPEFQQPAVTNDFRQHQFEHVSSANIPKSKRDKDMLRRQFYSRLTEWKKKKLIDSQASFNQDMTYDEIEPVFTFYEKEMKESQKVQFLNDLIMSGGTMLELSSRAVGKDVGVDLEGLSMTLEEDAVKLEEECRQLVQQYPEVEISPAMSLGWHLSKTIVTVATTNMMKNWIKSTPPTFQRAMETDPILRERFEQSMMQQANETTGGQFGRMMDSVGAQFTPSSNVSSAAPQAAAPTPAGMENMQIPVFGPPPGKTDANLQNIFKDIIETGPPANKKPRRN